MISACNQHPAANQDTDSARSSRTDTATRSYFPVGDYLLGEIRLVDSTPLAIRLFNTQGNHTDSGFLRPDEFNRLAAAFVLPALQEDSLEKNYSEATFQDATTGYLTITYSPKTAGNSIHRVDVLSAPGVSANKVKSVYIEQTARTGDTPTLHRMLWQSGRSFQITTTLEPPGKPAILRLLRVVWEDPAMENQ